MPEGSPITGRVDVHAHLIPGVDDGCEDVDQAVACARAFVAAGYSDLCCTPHIWPSLPRNTMGNIVAWTAALQQEFDRRLIPVKLHPGGEINLTPKFLQTPPEAVVTYGGRRKFVIFDLWADRLPDHFEPSVRWFQSLGLQPILAHPERMRAVQDDPELADYFAELGLLLQGNLQCFGDPPGADTRRTAERFLEENRYFCLGSDCHGPSTLPIRLEGLARATTLAGEDAIRRLTVDNPRRLLAEA